jgi:hypothetical protein
MHPYQRQIDLCNRALGALWATLTADQLRTVDEYINQFNEWGLGIETLIDFLVESDVKISQDQFSLLREAMDSMGLGDRAGLAYLRARDMIGD